MTTAGPSPDATPEANPDTIPGATPDANTSLRDFSGLIALVGAGKMGGALLEGWLRLGLDPRKVAVLEPEPLPHIAALASRGVRLNPAADTLRQANVIVIALKPQAAGEARGEHTHAHLLDNLPHAVEMIFRHGLLTASGAKKFLTLDVAAPGRQ